MASSPSTRSSRTSPATSASCPRADLAGHRTRLLWAGTRPLRAAGRRDRARARRPRQPSPTPWPDERHAQHRACPAHSASARSTVSRHGSRAACTRWRPAPTLAAAERRLEREQRRPGGRRRRLGTDRHHLGSAAHTRRLLADIAAETAAAPVSHLLLTHADGDHVNGAQLLPQARLVAARAALHELDHEDPAALHRSRLGAGLLGRVGIGAPRRFGAYVRWMMEPFDFRGITTARPTPRSTATWSSRSAGGTSTSCTSAPRTPPATRSCTCRPRAPCSLATCSSRASPPTAGPATSRTGARRWRRSRRSHQR